VIDYSLEVQAAVFNALKNHAGLDALIEGVYDHVPEGAAFPYVTIGDDVVTPLQSHNPRGQIIALSIHTWSVADGRHEAKQIMREVTNALTDVPVAIGSAHVYSFEPEISQTIPDPDEYDVTYHGVQRFRLQIHEGS
jgi:hypothetical protein